MSCQKNSQARAHETGQDDPRRQIRFAWNGRGVRVLHLSCASRRLLCDGLRRAATVKRMSEDDFSRTIFLLLPDGREGGAVYGD
jgi:hypothetical protein